VNDHSEYILAKRTILEGMLPKVVEGLTMAVENDKEIAERVEEKGGPEEFGRFLSDWFVDQTYEIVGEGFYVLSFVGSPTNSYVKENGLLSQWRGYGTSQGYALVFETKKLEIMFESEFQSFAYEAAFLSDAVYGPDDPLFKLDIEPKINGFAVSVLKRIQQVLVTQSESKEPFSIIDFCQVATALKHEGFREENEVRGVFLPYSTHHKRSFVIKGFKPPEHQRQLKAEKLKSNGDVSKPYIELLGPNIGKLPLKRIIVGPGGNKNKAAHALRVFLNDESIEISVSETPFV
jgi:hypothetical protein